MHQLAMEGKRGAIVQVFPSETSDAGSAGVPRTAMELLERLTENGVLRLPALKSKIALLSAFLQKPPDQITIDDIHFAKPNLRAYLRGRRLAENSIQAYVSEIRTLLEHSSKMGWRPDAELPVAWTLIMDRCIEAKCDNLCRYVIRRRKSPKQVTCEDVDSWIAEYVQQGRAWSTARAKSTTFWRVLAACGVLKELPASLKENFGIALEKFPDDLKREVKDVLNWRVATHSAGRSKRGKIREESASNVRRSLSELFGYAVRIRGCVGINSILELVTPEIVNQYVEWALNERKVRGQSVHSRLVIITALLNQHPRYRDYDATWLKQLTDAIPTDSPSELREKQAAKQVPYSLVETIPEKIRSERKHAARQSDFELALTVRDELLMQWLMVLPWRQRNIRECRLDGARPNLFKAKLSPFLPVAKPKWVLEALKENPETEFWQFKFSPHETKVGNGVHALVPRPLIPLLEEYISNHRKHLVGDSASEYLLLSETGTMISRARMTITVGELTLRHIGKRITPHTYRHIVAYAWLDSHPEDFLTLSKILWHTNINTTLRCYGATFNESNGVCGIETWVERRRNVA